MLGVERVLLPNGLKVLLRRDRRLPLASILTFVGAGYFDEPDHLIGISHLIEHLMFKGTPTRGVGQIARETKRLGGHLNAGTIYDHTYYYAVVPRESVQEALAIQCDVIRNPLFEEGEIEKEKGVIVHELRRKLDNPHLFSREKLLELAFDRHPIRRWRMGNEEDIQRISREDIVSYFQRYYTASNMVLVVVGDIDPEAVMAQIRESYGDLPTVPVEREAIENEKPQSGPRLLRLSGDVSHSLMKVGFHAPPLFHPDHSAFVCLSTLLGRGRSCRLYRALKEEKGLVDGISSHFYAAKGIGYFMLEGELKSKSIAEAEAELLLEIARLAEDPPAPEEIARIRNVVETRFFAGLEELMGDAHTLAYYEFLDRWECAYEEVNRIRAVEGKDLLRVAERYCQFDQLSIVEHVPADLGEGAPAPWRLESLNKRLEKGLANKKVGEIQPVKPADPLVWVPTQGERGLSQFETMQLSNGPQLLYLRDASRPLVSIGVFFPGGRLDETSNNCGITRFLLRSSLKGTENRSAEEISFQAESMGSQVRMEAAADHFGYSMISLTRNFEPALSLLGDLIFNPTFLSTEVEKEKAGTIAGIRQMKDDMFRRPIELFYRALYGLHPYGLPRRGTEETVHTLGRNQLLDWHAQTFIWKKMVIVVVGDVERERVVSSVEEQFGVAQDAEDNVRAQIYPVVPARGIREEIEERAKEQTGLALGFNGVGLRERDFYALEVLRNAVGGMGGRLFSMLRDTRSLVYTVALFNIGLLRGGAFFSYLATSPANEDKATAVLLAELQALTEKRLTEEEMRMGKQFAKGSHAIGFQTNRAVLSGVVQYHLAQLGLEAFAQYPARVDGVTAEDVVNVARRVINPEQYALGMVRGVKS